MTIGLDVRNIFRASPRIVLIASILAFLISNKTIALRFSAYFIITEILVVLFKNISKATFPIGSISRPLAFAGQCTGCGTYFNCGQTEPSDDIGNYCINVSGHVGMPSGHSATMMMSATFWSWWIFRNGTGNIISKAIRSGLLILLALAVVISRTSFVENCHTLGQVTVGSIIGIILGTGFYFFDDYLVAPALGKL